MDGVYTEQVDEILRLKDKNSELQFVLKSILNEIEANRWKYDYISDEWIENAKRVAKNEVASWIK